MSEFSKHLTTCIIASTSLIWDKNLLPKPSPLLAPLTSPAMSTNCICAGITFLDLTKSVVVGSDENWFGQIYFNSGLDANAVFNYFKEHMPDTGWFLIMEQQGNQIFLVYEKDLRTAIISISRKRSGADTVLAVAPRAQ